MVVSVHHFLYIFSNPRSYQLYAYYLLVHSFTSPFFVDDFDVHRVDFEPVFSPFIDNRLVKGEIPTISLVYNWVVGVYPYSVLC